MNSSFTIGLSLMSAAYLGAQGTVVELVRELQKDPFDLHVIDRLVTRAESVVPLIRKLLKLEDDRLRLDSVGVEHATVPVRVPIAKVRAVEILRRCGGSAEAALPDLLRYLETVPPEFFGNVLEAITYIVPFVSDPGRRVGGLDGVLFRRRLKFARNDLFLVVRRDEGSVVVPVHATLLERFDAVRRRPPLSRNAGHLEDRLANHNLFVVEMVCFSMFRQLPGGEARIAIASALLNRLERFYPDNQSTESSMHRDMVNKANPRYLDSLSRATIRVAPDRAVLAYVHFMQSGRLTDRRAAILSIRKLRGRGAAAVPWLLSIAKYEGQELAIEAFVTLGRLGATAKPALPDLRFLAKSRDRFRATRATATIEQIAN
jgi:hypothetical protein